MFECSETCDHYGYTYVNSLCFTILNHCIISCTWLLNYSKVAVVSSPLYFVSIFSVTCLAINELAEHMSSIYCYSI